MRRVTIASVCLSGLGVLASCGLGPARQEPVRLEPGLYQVDFSGAAYNPFPQTAPVSPEKKVCVADFEADTFPQSYPRKFFSRLGYSCDGPLSEREGNRITGKVVCAFADGVPGNLTTNFEGTVSADSLDVRARLKLNIEAGPGGKVPDDLDPSVLDDVELRLALRRVGDCPA